MWVCMPNFSNILSKNWRINLIFDERISINVFYRLISSFFMTIAWYAQITQQFCEIFAISQDRREGWSWFFYVQVNTKTFLQVDSINFRGQGQSCPKCWKSTLYKIFILSQERRKRWSWFLLQINIVDTIIFDKLHQAYLKYSEKVCNIFAIPQERNEWLKWFFDAGKHQFFRQVDTIISL